MPLMSQPAFGPKLAIGFITGGSLIDVITLVWRFTQRPEGLRNNDESFIWWSLLLTGATFLVIGAFLGSIGRAARKAELPPTEKTTRTEAAIQQNAAANPNPMVSGAMAAPGMVPGAMMPGMMPGAAMPGMAVPAAPVAPVAAPVPPPGTVRPRPAM